jgi:hypothetical protein
MTEKELQRAVIKLAHVFHWKVCHFRPARTAKGWRTPVEADGAGFPDLVLVRGRHVMFRELKGDKGRLSPAQWAWLAALRGAEANVGVWTPADWRSGLIWAELKGED